MSAQEPAVREKTVSGVDIIFTLSADGVITSLNPMVEKITGASRSELLRKSILDFIHADDIPLVQHCLREVLRGKPQPVDEFRLRTRADDWRIVKFTTTLQSWGVIAKDILVVARDITEAKRAEQRMVMYAHTITSMHECVVITDLQQKIIFVNPAFVAAYGFNEQDIIGKETTLLLSPSNPEPPGDIMRRALSSEGWHGELLHVRSTGEEFPVMVSTSSICDKQGKLIAWAMMTRDITDQKRMQEQLETTARQREEDLKHFAQSVQDAHEEERQRLSRDLHDDLGQVVTLIRINLERAVNTGEGGMQKQLIQHALSAAQNVLARIHEIAVLLRPPVIDDFGLREAIETYLEDFELKTGIRTESRLTFRNTAIPEGISTGVYRILQEALTNVSKHSGAASVRIELESEAGQITLLVEDHGRGFDYGGSSKMSKSLGLLGMRERTELMNGAFTLDSSPGLGTKIRAIIPLPPKAD